MNKNYNKKVIDNLKNRLLFGLVIAIAAAIIYLVLH